MKRQIIVTVLCLTAGLRSQGFQGATAPEVDAMLCQMAALNAAPAQVVQDVAMMTYPLPTLASMASEGWQSTLDTGRDLYGRAVTGITPYATQAALAGRDAYGRAMTGLSPYADRASIFGRDLYGRAAAGASPYVQAAASRISPMQQNLTSAMADPRNQAIATLALVLVGGLAWNLLSPREKAAVTKEAEANIAAEVAAIDAVHAQIRADEELARRLAEGDANPS